MDAGANDGRTTLMIAKEDAFAGFGIVSVEPVRTNVQSIKNLTSGFGSVSVIHGGIGASEGQGSYGASIEGKPGYQTGSLTFVKKYVQRAHEEHQIPFKIHTVDKLFANRRLALAHWDVEGKELEVLQGGAAVLRRDEPVFTLESFPQSNPLAHAALKQHVTEVLGYHMLEIDEICGAPVDCRNFLCVPPRLWQHLPPSCTSTVVRHTRHQG